MRFAAQHAWLPLPLARCMAPWLNCPVEPSWHCWLKADLAGRDFAAERDPAVVVSTGAAVSDLDRERSAEARAVAEVQYLLEVC